MGVRSSLENLQSQLGDTDDALVRLLEADLSDTITIPAESLNAVDEYDFDTITRYLYSCLVDADFLDTEQHFDPRRAESREARDLQPDTLLEKLNNRLESFKLDTPINRLRTGARSECVGNAQKKPGIYSLILPTGLGKTLTSVAWALEHARWNSLKRIIIVLPYTNIIDQTAMQLKSIFGLETVLEHHSGIADRDDEERSYDRRKLATENWSSPIIITTTVQFFESLFSNRSSKCRKIHNIADSIVIFDEVQTLPKESIKPTLRMLINVQKFFGASFLFCTATMPAFEKRKGFMFGIDNIVPLIKNPEPLFEKTRRVHYSALNGLEEVEEPELIDLAQKEQKSVLVIFPICQRKLSPQLI